MEVWLWPRKVLLLPELQAFYGWISPNFSARTGANICAIIVLDLTSFGEPIFEVFHCFEVDQLPVRLWKFLFLQA